MSMTLLGEPYDEIFLYIGLAYICLTLLSVILSFLRVIRRSCASNLLARYGNGSWAVITGGSDGIGRGFAEQLAKRGFNLVLIARNRSKLERVASEVNALNNKIKIKIIVAEFSESYKAGFFDEIYNQIKGLDVSILVNNVGVDLIQPFEENDEEYLRKLLTINLFPICLMSRKLINQLNSRPNRSAIINLSSASRVIEMPYLSVYASTKDFDYHFSRSLQIEYPNMDIICISPGYVSTPMTNNKSESFDTISPNDCAEGTLREIGRYDSTFGHIKHEMMAWLMVNLPKWLRDILVKHIFMPMEMNRRKLAQSDSLNQPGTKKNNGIYIPLVEENK